jgi:hypothetical protein
MSATRSARRRFVVVIVVALAGFVARSSADAQTTDARDSSTARFAIGSARTTLGFVQFDLADLDTRFAAAGLPHAASSAATIGISTDVRAGRFLFGAGFQSLLSRNNADAAYRTRTSGGYSLFDVGYAIVDTPRFAIYPLVGVGATHVAVNVKSRGDFSFDDGLHSPGRDLGVSGTAGLVHAGLVAERRFRRASGSQFALSVRAGLTRNLGSQMWQSDESRVDGGPRGVRGSYVTIGFSKPLSSRRQAALPFVGTLLQTIPR